MKITVHCGVHGDVHGGLGWVTIEKLLPERVDEVRGLTHIHRTKLNAKRPCGGCFGVVSRDETMACHLVEHDVPSCPGLVLMAKRGSGVGRTDEGSQEGGFFEF